MFLKILPNFLTTLNIACGVLSILLISIHGRNHLLVASLLILLGGVFDGLDGKVARLTGGESDFGKQLDALADLVTFGVAPMCLYVAIGLAPSGLLSYFVMLVYPLAGAFRLARYNVSSKSCCFCGCPITLAGMLLAVFTLIFEWLPLDFVFIDRWMTTSILLLSLLMISKLKVKRVF
jgi:CDP-diacylglycerol--serine O-phosphatidyltransferase